MAVREFNAAASDYCRLSIGGFGSATYGTFGAIFKVTDTALFRGLIVFLTSGQAFAWAGLLIDDNDRINYSGTGDIPLATAIPQGAWLTLISRKATGTATPRFSYYNHSTGLWTHGNGTGSTGDGTAPTSGFISAATSGAGGEAFHGRLAVTAGWANQVKWSADTTGDAQIEAAGLHTSLVNWSSQSPTGLWRWDGTVAATISDQIGTANQVAISGTTQITGDDPPGFSFASGPAPTAPSLFVIRPSYRVR